jgi:hypothetical protein
MDLFIIDPENPEAHNALFRGYNCLRYFEGYLIEEVIALAYIEALTYTKAYNRLYLKTW